MRKLLRFRSTTTSGSFYILVILTLQNVKVPRHFNFLETATFSDAMLSKLISFSFLLTLFLYCSPGFLISLSVTACILSKKLCTRKSITEPYTSEFFVFYLMCITIFSLKYTIKYSKAPILVPKILAKPPSRGGH